MQDRVGAGTTICVQQVTSAEYGTSNETTLIVGEGDDATKVVFSTTTIAKDISPKAFYFASSSVVANSFATGSVTISEINAPAPVSVENGEYSVGCTESYTSQAGFINNGQSLCVKHLVTGQGGTEVTRITVGDYSTEFQSSSSNLPVGHSGGGGGSLGVNALGLFGLLAVRFFRKNKFLKSDPYKLPA